MKKSTKIIIISLVAAIVIAAAAIVTVLVIRKSQNTSTDTVDTSTEIADEYGYDTVQFGSYPQSKVTDESIIKKLNSKELDWKSYDYFYYSDEIGDSVQGDFMRYADVTLDGERYRAVTMDDSRGFSEDHGYLCNTTYWFLYEPLTWRILDAETGLLLCDKIIDAQTFSDVSYMDDLASPNFYKDKQHSHYLNNYTVSDIRSWLNSTFLTTAFTAQERQKIETTSLDNTAYPKKDGEGDPYDFDCSPTDDKIYLLSYKDMLNGQYGFDEDAETHDDNRSAEHRYTDYALIQGLTIANDLTSSDNMTASWMLRTPGIYSQSICYVGWYGELYSEGSADGSLDGIRPALNSNAVLGDKESKPTEEQPSTVMAFDDETTTAEESLSSTTPSTTEQKTTAAPTTTTTKVTTTQPTTQKLTAAQATTTQTPTTTQTTTKQETTKKVTLSSIRLSSYPTKRSYYIDESFDKSGAKVEASYSDGSTKDVTNQCTFTTKPFTSRGDYTVTVSYSENGDKKTLDFSVPVNEYTLKLDRTSLQIFKGESQQLTATTTPANKSVQWSSYDDSVVTVSGGKVSGKKEGTAVITATIGSGAYKKTATCSVTVKKVEVTAVTVTPSSKTIKVGETFTLTKTVTPSNADSEDKKATWSSADKSIATVTVKDGTVTVKGIKAGSTTISAKVPNGKYGTCVVTVTDTGVTGVSVNPSTKTVSEGESFTITATISPSNASNKTLTWTSSDTGVATVKTNGTKATITAVKGGTAKITAASANGKQAVCTVTVKGATISVSPTSKTIYVGDTLKLTATISPSTASGQIIAWSSSNNSIATVSASSNGTTATVTGVKGSSNAVTITATLANGNKATCRVTVKSNDISSINVGGTYKKSYVKGEPIDTSGMKLTVKYSNGKTETVTSGFTVSPKTATGSTIQVTYAGKTTSYSITLVTPSITISTATSVYFGDENKITRKMTPDSGWSGGEYYTSSDVLEIPGDVVFAGFEAGSYSFYYQASYNGQIIKSNTVTVTIKKEKPVELHIENESYVYNTTYSSLTSSKIDVWGYFQNNQGIEKPVGDLPCKISKAGYNEDADAYVIRVYYTRDGYNILFSDIFYDSTSSKPTEIVYYNL